MHEVAIAHVESLQNRMVIGGEAVDAVDGATFPTSDPATGQPIMETLDSGKPLSESRGDVETAAYYFEYYAGIADKLRGDTIPLGPDYISVTLHEPVGVTAHIIPCYGANLKPKDK